MSALLIVGLGNPGPSYRNTRHNLGFLAVESWVKQWGGRWKKPWLMKAQIVEGEVEGRRVFGLLPQSYMNLSGPLVASFARKKKIDLSELLVVCDDIYLPFGKLRLRKEGSAGGHNGLKSVEEAFRSSEYARLRIGVGEPQGKIDLAEYVLETFTSQEQEALPLILSQAVGEINKWIKEAPCNRSDKR